MCTGFIIIASYDDLESHIKSEHGSDEFALLLFEALVLLALSRLLFASNAPDESH